MCRNLFDFYRICFEITRFEVKIGELVLFLSFFLSFLAFFPQPLTEVYGFSQSGVGFSRVHLLFLREASELDFVWQL